MMKLLIREIRALVNSPWQLALLTYIPVIGILLLWGLFSAGSPRALPVAVVDLDQSSISRTLILDLQANPTITTHYYSNLQEAKRAMQKGDVYALLYLPHHLKIDLLTGQQPTIDIRYNSQFLLVGKLLSSQLQLSLASSLKAFASIKQLALGALKQQVAVNLSPVSNQTSALFNQNNNYVAFLVPPILISLLQIIAMLVFINSLSHELNRPKQDNCYQHGIGAILLTKVYFYSAFMLFHGAVIYTFIYQYLNIPSASSPAMLMIALLFMLLAIWLIVLTIFFLLKDSTRTVSLCSALFAPAFSFMGITFPSHDMPQLAQIWRALMPSSHYIEQHVATISYGQNIGQLFNQLSAYSGYLILLIPLLYLIKKGDYL